MNDESYALLVRMATKGDRQAIDELFDIGESHAVRGEYQQSAVAFKDAAISFRIQAFRNSALAEKYQGRAKWLEVESAIVLKWIRNHSAVASRPNHSIDNIDEERMTDIVLQILDDDYFAGVAAYLDNVLTELGVEFFSPGGSPQRYIVQLVYAELSGQADDFLDQLSVRIGIDQIVAEVERRWPEIRP